MRTDLFAPVSRVYVLLLPALEAAAHELGYALAFHGSLARDLDVVAIPWTEEACDAAKLIGTLVRVCDGFLIKDVLGRVRHGRDPASKPHGRLAWSIHLSANAYIDLSVMPRKQDWKVENE